MTAVQVKINAEKCKGCNLCVAACPKSLLVSSKSALNKSGYFVAEMTKPDECVGCINCALMCPDGAISVYKQ
jgi:2-oxoglutarate ferredoxin oxidoreductase subunit delta